MGARRAASHRVVVELLGERQPARLRSDGGLIGGGDERRVVERPRRCFVGVLLAREERRDERAARHRVAHRRPQQHRAGGVVGRGDRRLELANDRVFLVRRGRRQPDGAARTEASEGRQVEQARARRSVNEHAGASARVRRRRRRVAAAAARLGGGRGRRCVAAEASGGGVRRAPRKLAGGVGDGRRRSRRPLGPWAAAAARRARVAELARRRERAPPAAGGREARLSRRERRARRRRQQRRRPEVIRARQRSAEREFGCGQGADGA